MLSPWTFKINVSLEIAANKIDGQGKGVLDVFFRKDRNAGRNIADDGNVIDPMLKQKRIVGLHRRSFHSNIRMGSFDFFTFFFIEILHDARHTGFAPVALQITLLRQFQQMAVYGGRRGKPDGRADFANGRGIAVFFLKALDKLQNFHLFLCARS